MCQVEPTIDGEDLIIGGARLEGKYDLYSSCKFSTKGTKGRWYNAERYLQAVSEHKLIPEADDWGCGTALLLIRCDDDQRDTVLSVLDRESKESLLEEAYHLLTEAEMDLLMTELRYMPVGIIYNEDDRAAMMEFIHGLESSGISIPDTRKGGLYANPLTDAFIEIRQHDLLHYDYLVADMLGDTVELDKFRWGYDEDYEGMELSDRESLLFKHFVVKLLGEKGWEPGSQRILECYKWEGHIGLEDGKEYGHKGIGDYPFNTRLMINYIKTLIKNRS